MSAQRAESTSALPAPKRVRRSRPLLRAALQLDAVVTGANGAAYVAAAQPLEDLLGLPAPLLRGTGVAFLGLAALLWLTAARPDLARRAARAIVAGNALWAVASVVAAITGWQSPTTAGTAWIVLQAAVVAGFAALQHAGLRRQVASRG